MFWVSDFCYSNIYSVLALLSVCLIVQERSKIIVRLINFFILLVLYFGGAKLLKTRYGIAFLQQITVSLHIEKCQITKFIFKNKDEFTLIIFVQKTAAIKAKVLYGI